MSKRASFLLPAVRRTLFAALCVVCFLGTIACSQAPFGLLLPVATAYDSAGNLFFADARRHQVFELTLAGQWTVVAGTGEQGFGGDGSAATAALLNAPHGVAVGADGTLYIADTGNQRVRAVAHGVISTIAGSGVRGFSGDGAALQTALRDPSALAVEPGGNLLICDSGNHRVRRLAAGKLTTAAGTGEQGFAGDGGKATAAELDTPLGVAVNASGTILIADTHNNRVRQIDANGVISTLAGNGRRGFAGDGSGAAVAALDLPIGVAFEQDGTVLIADSGNQRIRAVSAAGVITTVAGSGVQGRSEDAVMSSSAVLDTPRSVAQQPLGPVAFTDSSNALVRELALDNALYTLAVVSAPHTSTVSLNALPTVVYGQGAANVSVVSSAAVPVGTVMLLDNGATLSSAQLAAGKADFTLGQMTAGRHMLTARYAGDGLHAGSESAAAVPVTITPAAAIASATPVSMVYGAPLPVFTGTLSGILSQDAASVQAVYSSTAGSLSSPGTYPITAALSGTGSANYTLALAPASGALLISRAASTTSLAPVSQTYAGLPLLLSASVASTTSGSPTGSIEFLDGPAVVATASLVNGAAAASLLSAQSGSHSYSARYVGDANFTGSDSAATSVTVAAMPDFGLAFGSPSQSVQAGGVAVFTLSVSPQNGPFTGAVVFSVSGLPQGAVATFTPTAVVPGASVANVNLSIQTVARSGALRQRKQGEWLAGFGAFALLWFVPYRRRRKLGVRFLSALAFCGSVSLLGCGTRTSGTVADASQAVTMTLTVRGTGTNLAGAAISHVANATLSVF